MQKIITYLSLFILLFAVLLYFLSRTAFSDLPDSELVLKTKSSRYIINRSPKGEPIVITEADNHISVVAGYVMSYDRLLQNLLWLNLARGTLAYATGDTAFQKLDATIMRLLPDSLITQFYSRLPEQQKKIVRAFHNGFISGWNERIQNDKLPVLYFSHLYQFSPIQETDWLRSRLLQNLLTTGLLDKALDQIIEKSDTRPELLALIAHFRTSFYDRLPPFAHTRQFFWPGDQITPSAAIFEFNYLPFLTWSVAFPGENGDTLRVLYNAGDAFPRAIFHKKSFLPFQTVASNFELKVGALNKNRIKKMRMRVQIKEDKYFWSFKESIDDFVILAENGHLYLGGRINNLSSISTIPTVTIKNLLKTSGTPDYKLENTPLVLNIEEKSLIVEKPMLLPFFPMRKHGIDLFSDSLLNLRRLIPPLDKGAQKSREEKAFYNDLMYDSISLNPISFQPVAWSKLFSFWREDSSHAFDFLRNVILDMDKTQFENYALLSPQKRFHSYFKQFDKHNWLQPWYSTIQPTFKYFISDRIVNSILDKHAFSNRYRFGLGPERIWSLDSGKHIFCTFYRTENEVYGFNGPWTEQLNQSTFWVFNQ